MKSRPALFNAPMVRALLDETKTQTRRIMKPQPIGIVGGRQRRLYRDEDFKKSWRGPGGSDQSDGWKDCPYGQPGDQLWVRETWGLCAPFDFTDWERSSIAGMKACPVERQIEYRADWENDHEANFWRPSIHMPRWASRITLEITGVRVERLNDISRGDCMQEGCPFPNMANGPDPRTWYRELWESCYGPGSWDANSWVWVVEFKRVEVKP